MANVAKLPPQKTTTYVGSVEDLRAFLSRLDEGVDGLEETYELNTYQDRQTGEKWLEIKPTN
jgi:hypothetical protein